MAGPSQRHRCRLKVGFSVTAIVTLILYVYVSIIMPRSPRRYRYETERAPVMNAPPVYLHQLSWGATVAVGSAVTTREKNYEKRIKTSPNACKDIQCSLNRSPFFVDLLPSFCRTASGGFDYHFYVSYDFDDPVLGNTTANGNDIFRTVFHNVTIMSGCAHIPVELHLVKCSHSRQPARAQNDAMMAAYLDNMTYYFRLNDDTLLVTDHWTEAFMTTLRHMDPPNVGIVAPSTRGDVNSKILTYEFVHRTHIEIFGFYYPAVMENWFADDWITHVYLPGRAVTLNDVFILHTRTTGRRYEVNMQQIALSELDDLIEVGKTMVSQWAHRGSHKAPGIL